jgi:hypothetical protein
LNRMADEEQEGGRQILIDTHWGQGRCYGVKVLPEHPAWSGQKLGQLAPILAGESRKWARPLSKNQPRDKREALLALDGQEEGL